MTVSKYSDWQFRELKKDNMIDEAAGKLRAIIKNPVEYISECDELRIKRVIDYLCSGIGIGTVERFPAEELVVNGELVKLDPFGVYVIIPHVSNL
jgi:hypothetical protein